jgi:hypothetical protein
MLQRLACVAFKHWVLDLIKIFGPVIHSITRNSEGGKLAPNLHAGKTFVLKQTAYYASCGLDNVLTINMVVTNFSDLVQVAALHPVF